MFWDDAWEGISWPDIIETSFSGKEFSAQICWYHIIGVAMYIWASLHQHRCLVILANLRKSKSGKMFHFCQLFT